MSPKKSGPAGAGHGKDPRAKRTQPRRTSARRLPARSSSVRQEKLAEGGPVRLNKFLADHGVASRRACDQLIEEGKVTVDGEIVTALGTRIDPATQQVEVDGVLYGAQVDRRYYLLNKPTGVVCTNERRETRPRAVDLVTDRNKGRIYTVGRLDEESRGLILLTSDGEFAQRVAHPRYGVSKTYRVRVQGRIPDEGVQRIREGIHLSDGRTAGARVVVMRRQPSSSTLLVTLREGKNREVRRVFARVGFKVIDLVRTDIGPLNDRGLKVGHWRALSREEVESLMRASGSEGVQEEPEPETRRRPGGDRRPARGGAGEGRGRGSARTDTRTEGSRGGSSRGNGTRGGGSRAEGARGALGRSGGTRGGRPGERPAGPGRGPSGERARGAGSSAPERGRAPRGPQGGGTRATGRPVRGDDRRGPAPRSRGERDAGGPRGRGRDEGPERGGRSGSGPRRSGGPRRGGPRGGRR